MQLQLLRPQCDTRCSIPLFSSQIISWIQYNLVNKSFKNVTRRKKSQSKLFHDILNKILWMHSTDIKKKTLIYFHQVRFIPEILVKHSKINQWNYHNKKEKSYDHLKWYRKLFNILKVGGSIQFSKGKELIGYTDWKGGHKIFIISDVIAYSKS